MTKVIALAVLVAVTHFESCGNRDMPKQLQETYQLTRTACLDRGGVPIVDFAIDDSGGASYPVVASCALPPVISSHGEK